MQRLRGLQWERERERFLGKVGRMETVRSSILPKDITDRERSNSAGKSDNAGNRAGPRRENISWIRETKHHMNRKTNIEQNYWRPKLASAWTRSTGASSRARRRSEREPRMQRMADRARAKDKQQRIQATIRLYASLRFAAWELARNPHPFLHRQKTPSVWISVHVLHFI